MGGIDPKFTVNFLPKNRLAKIVPNGKILRKNHESNDFEEFPKIIPIPFRKQACNVII